MKLHTLSNRGKTLSPPIIGLLLLVMGIPNAWGVHVVSIRHGIHQKFERVVFDVSSPSQYEIKSLDDNKTVKIWIYGVDPQDPLPSVQLSPVAGNVLAINRSGPGSFQISTRIPVTAKTFTIQEPDFRIVIDLYPQENANSSQSSRLNKMPPKEEPQTTIPTSKPAPSITDIEPEKENTSSDEKVENSNSDTTEKTSYNFNSLYNAKTSALQMQTLGKLDSAAVCWEKYLEIARELRSGIVGKDFGADVNTANAGDGDGTIVSNLMGKKLFIFLPIALLLIASMFWIVNRVSTRMGIFNLSRKILDQVEDNVENPQEEPKEEKLPKKKPLPAAAPVDEVKNTKEDSEVQEEVELEETVEESELTEVIKEEPPEEDHVVVQEEEAALEEFFNADEEPSDEEKKVQRILELAGEEKSISEIAEEMGIGEDEVRLVLDLQGTDIKATVEDDI